MPRSGRVELLDGALFCFRGEVGVAHRHFEGGVAHPLLDDLERDTPHGETLAVLLLEARSPHPCVRGFVPPRS